MRPTESKLQTVSVPSSVDVIAPDGSEIRVLAQTGRGSMVHCTLPPGATSVAVTHRTVDELWYCLQGHGEVWRSLDGCEEITALGPGVSLSIPLGALFQFRNLGPSPLVLIIVTMPPWPGNDEAYPVQGAWPSGDQLNEPPHTSAQTV